MKNIILIFWVLVFTSSCTSKSYYHFDSMYSYALDNPDQNDRIGYKDKVCTVLIEESPIDCKIDLLDYNDKCEYVIIHTFKVKKGDNLKQYIKGEYLDIEIHIEEFTHFMSGQYFYSAHRVCLSPYIQEALSKFKVYNDNL